MKDGWETAYTKVNSNCTRDEVMRALHITLALTLETYALMEKSSVMAYSGLVSHSRMKLVHCFNLSKCSHNVQLL